jgi:hypothetical protein
VDIGLAHRLKRNEGRDAGMEFFALDVSRETIPSVWKNPDFAAFCIDIRREMSRFTPPESSKKAANSA